MLTIHGLEIPADVHTCDGFRAWYASLDEDAGIRATYASGEVFVEMSPQDYTSHEPVVTAIHRVLLELSDELGSYYLPPSWVTVEGLLSTEPDGFLVAWDRLRSGEVQVNPDRSVELVGVPDMTLEVVSKTSVKKDLDRLRADYARAGVREYWIADAHDGLSLKILRLEGDRFVDPEPDPDGWVPSTIWRRSFRLVPWTNPAGQRDYRLEARPQPSR